MERAYKYRIYPNKNQEELINKTFGCVRFVYNYYLNKRKELYENEKVSFTYNMCSKDLTQLKVTLEWLKEPDKDSLQKSLKDLDYAYQKFFKQEAPTSISRSSSPPQYHKNLMDIITALFVVQI